MFFSTKNVFFNKRRHISKMSIWADTLTHNDLYCLLCDFAAPVFEPGLKSTGSVEQHIRNKNYLWFSCNVDRFSAKCGNATTTGPPDSLVSPATVHFSARDFVEKTILLKKTNYCFFQQNILLKKTPKCREMFFSTKNLYKNRVVFLLKFPH